MPAYNGERFIKEAIDSLRGQSYVDWVMLISDDASTDKTRAICEEYAKKDQRITYYRQEKNIGMFPNFKFVLDSARGDYFMWASHDDLWEKDFLKVCVENIKNKKVDVATTVVADIDSYGRNLRELTELTKFSGKPSIKQVARYVLQPEILGKCNLMYSVFRTSVIKKVWEIYPQRKEWGSDYHFSLTIISHFSVYIDKRILFRKRLGGFSSPDSTKNDDPDTVRRVTIKNPKNHMFPFGRFRRYFGGHMGALKGTPYRPLVALLLLVRLPRSFFVYLKERNYKKFLKYLTH
mgnify:FL=1